MAKRLRRLVRILWLALRPIPRWKDTMQSIVSFLVIIAPTLAGIFRKLKGPEGWTLRDGFFASIGLFAVAVAVAAYRIQEKLDDILEGVPKLVCKGASFHDNPIVRNSMEMEGSPAVPVLRSRIVGTPTFYHLRITNEPTGVIDRKVAEKVAARVQVFHENGTPAAKERLHRWEHSPGPAEAGKSADQLLPLDIPPSGIECNLDIAMKYDEDDSFHTPNNETVMRGSPDWREEDFKFPPGIYVAEIRFRGANVVSNLKCQIVNKGKGSKLEITPLSS